MLFTLDFIKLLSNPRNDHKLLRRLCIQKIVKIFPEPLEN